MTPDATPERDTAQVTLGQIAYTAWHAIVIPALCPGYQDDWNEISDLEQRAWHAAASAVFDACQAQPCREETHDAA